jgi:hypothetical protein
MACTPSKECGRCLLTMIGLAQSATRLLVHKWGNDGCTAFDVFDVSPMHKAALFYSLPICPTSHDPD